MSNGRSMRRNLSGRSGSSPQKSLRRRRKQLKSQAAWAGLAAMSSELLESVEGLAEMVGDKLAEGEPKDSGPSSEGG